MPHGDHDELLLQLLLVVWMMTKPSGLLPPASAIAIETLAAGMEINAACSNRETRNVRSKG